MSTISSEFLEIYSDSKSIAEKSEKIPDGFFSVYPTRVAPGRADIDVITVILISLISGITFEYE